MPTTDLSTEALLVRREIAEKATPGKWGVKCERHDNTCHEYLILTEDGDKIVGADKIDLREVYYRSLPEAICSLDSHDAAHIAANSPDVVIATIDELLRLRAELEQYKDSIQSLRYVANNTLVDCNFRIKENISLKEEVLRLREENERLERELVRAIEVMECLLAGKPGGVYFQKYQSGLQIALRSAQRALSGAARRAVEEVCPE